MRNAAREALGWGPDSQNSPVMTDEGDDDGGEASVEG